MEDVLESVLEGCVILYVDDLVIHSPNEVQHEVEADLRNIINLLLAELWWLNIRWQIVYHEHPLLPWTRDIN